MDSMEHELPNVSESGGLAKGDAILGERGEELSENEIDVCCGEEIAAERRSDFGAKLMRFQELLLGTGVEKAERRVAVGAEHAAAAAIGEGKLAEGGVVAGSMGIAVVGFGAFCGHGSLKK